MSSLRSLAGDTLWYGISSFGVRFISWLLVPLYTAVMQTAEYGIITELYAYIAFLYVIYTYGMETAYFRFAKTSAEERQVFNQTFSTMLVTSLIFSSLLIVFSEPICRWLDYEGYEVFIYYLAAIIAIDAIVAMPYARLRFEKNAKGFALIKLLQVCVTITLNLFFFIVCDNIHRGEWYVELQPLVDSFYDQNLKVKYALLSNVLANVVTMVFLFRFFHGYRFTIRWHYLKPILIYGSPLLFMGLATVTNEMLSRTLLTRWLPENFYPGQTSKEALGVFGACYKLSIFMQLGIQAFRYAAEPFFFSNADSKESPKLFAKVMNGFIAFNALVFMAVSLNLEPLGMLVLKRPEYHQGLDIVPYLLMGYLFSGVYYNLSVWYKLTDKTRYGAIITGIGALLTVLLNYILIPIYGYFGSAVVTLVVYFSMSMISFVLGRKFYPVPYRVGRAFEYIALTTLATAMLYQIDIGHFWANVLIRNVGVAAFIVYLYLRERKALTGKQVFGIRLP